jgi:hypothetical protein
MTEIALGMDVGKPYRMVATNFVELNKCYQMSTVDGTKSYAFPTSYKEIVTMRILNGTSSYKLRLILPHVFDKYYPYPEGDSKDRSSIYVPRGNSFELYPIPDGAYYVQCHLNILPTNVTSTSTLIDFQPEKDELIVAGMTYRGFRHLQMYEDASYWQKTYIQLFLSAVERNEQMQDYEPLGQGFDSEQVISCDYWKKPLIMVTP